MEFHLFQFSVVKSWLFWHRWNIFWTPQHVILPLQCTRLCEVFDIASYDNINFVIVKFEMFSFSIHLPMWCFIYYLMSHDVMTHNFLIMFITFTAFFVVVAGALKWKHEYLKIVEKKWFEIINFMEHVTIDCGQNKCWLKIQNSMGKKWTKINEPHWKDQRSHRNRQFPIKWKHTGFSHPINLSISTDLFYFHA